MIGTISFESNLTMLKPGSFHIFSSIFLFHNYFSCLNNEIRCCFCQLQNCIISTVVFSDFTKIKTRKNDGVGNIKSLETKTVFSVSHHMMTYAPWDFKSLKYDLNKQVYEQNCIIAYQKLFSKSMSFKNNAFTIFSK